VRRRNHAPYAASGGRDDDNDREASGKRRGENAISAMYSCLRNRRAFLCARAAPAPVHHWDRVPPQRPFFSRRCPCNHPGRH
jgi:hypothetical protein